MSFTGISANRQELLQIADAVAREKSIDKSVVIASIEEAIQKAARSRYGADHDIRVHIDPKSGEMTITRVVTVAADEELENEYAQRSLTDALSTDKEAFVGKEYTEVLPPFELGRVQTQMARQVVTHKVREAERERQYDEFKDRVGEIVNGTVRRVEYGNVIVDLGRGEGIMRRDQSIPREAFQVNDRIRAYIYDVRRETKGPQIMLSRAHGGFMAKLFAQEVPEIYDGVIEIKSVARDPGSRAKMAVLSNDNSIDPVGACVGMRGSRVQAVVAELQGEKIDIIQWSPDEATFIVNAASKSWCRTNSCRWPSAAAARTSAWPRSLPAGRSTSSPKPRTASAVSASSPNGPPCSRKRSTSTKSSPSCWSPKASRRSKTWPMSTRMKSRRSKASTRTPLWNCRRVPATSSSAKPPNRTPSASNWVSRMPCSTSPA